MDGTVEGGVGERDATVDDCSLAVSLGARNVCVLVVVSFCCLVD